MNKILKYLLLAFLLFSAPSIFAQEKVDYLKFKKEHPDDNIIILNNEETIIISLKNGEFEIENNNIEHRLYLDENANLYSKESIGFSSHNKLVDISAKSCFLENGKYKCTKVKAFKTKDDLNGNIFHDDSKETEFFYPKLLEGSQTILEYNSSINDPKFISGFTFSSYVFTKRASYTIIADNNIELGFSFFNIDSSKISFSKEEKGGKTIYKWIGKDLDKLKHETGAPNIRFSLPHIIPRIKSYTYNGKTTKILGDLDDLFAWYASLIAESQTNEDNEYLKGVVDSIAKNSTTELEEVKNIYYWVQNHIKYIAFEAGMQGFIPEKAATVCEKRYGDCKGMSNIIHGMLDIANIKSHLTWIGTRSIPYKYEEVPTLAVDNHMITTYIADDGKYYFLDATDSYLPFGYPSSFIQGKEALLYIDSVSYEVKEVPVVSTENNSVLDSVYITIVNDSIKGSGQARLTGYYKARLTSKIADLDFKKKKDYITSYFSKGNNKFSIQKFEILNLTNKDQALIINYEFTLENYLTNNEDETYLNLFLEKTMSNDKILDDRENDIEYRFKSSITNKTVFHLPQAMQLVHLPQNTSSKNEKFGFDIIYHQEDDIISMEQNIYNNILILKKDDFEEWNKYIKNLNKAYRETVILKK